MSLVKGLFYAGVFAIVAYLMIFFYGLFTKALDQTAQDLGVTETPVISAVSGYTVYLPYLIVFSILLILTIFSLHTRRR